MMRGVVMKMCVIILWGCRFTFCYFTEVKFQYSGGKVFHYR